MDIRFGITMRVTGAEGYFEPRDTIARDWPRYIMEAFPQAKFLFIPNIESKAIEYIKAWDINVLIISGGDNIGVTPERDITEIELLKYAVKIDIPIIAVCRGLQLVHTYYGGKLLPGNDSFIKKHQSNKHKVKINNSVLEVNSYHTNMIDERTIAESFNIFARCVCDDSIEGIRDNNILAMMWHPERDEGICNWNKLLIENFLDEKYE